MVFNPVRCHVCMCACLFECVGVMFNHVGMHLYAENQIKSISSQMLKIN